MEIIIEEVLSKEDEAAMWEIRREVFERELGIRLAPDEAERDGQLSHLIARVYPGGQAVGTLSVADTSGDTCLHADHNLGFEPGTRAARFTHLAVSKLFRGRNVPVLMMLEAHRRFVAPLPYDFTWLLFDAGRAHTSFLSRLLGFIPKADIYVSEYGRRCPLVRDERTEEAARAMRLAGQSFGQSPALRASAATAGAAGAGYASSV
ncbi:MAG TPA: hypothetical protein VF703_08505 [Pyrinomonadaceae bacterium]